MELLLIPGALLHFQAMDKTLESIYLRQQDFFEAHGVEVWTEKEVKERQQLTFIKRSVPVPNTGLGAGDHCCRIL